MEKLLATSVIAVLGLTSVAFAGVPAEEAPSVPATTSSSDTGVYLGVEGGFGMTNWKNMEGFLKLDWEDPNTSISRDKGFVGRALLGYDINRYFAVEIGYTCFFNKPKSTWLGNSYDFVNKTHAVDFMGKIKATVVNKLDLYGKLGSNYLMISFEEGSDFDNRNNFNLAFGAGADYYITPNVIVNIEWLRFNGYARMEPGNYQANTDAFMIGLRYRFDD